MNTAVAAEVMKRACQQMAAAMNSKDYVELGRMISKRLRKERPVDTQALADEVVREFKCKPR